MTYEYEKIFVVQSYVFTELENMVEPTIIFAFLHESERVRFARYKDGIKRDFLAFHMRVVIETWRLYVIKVH